MLLLLWHHLFGLSAQNGMSQNERLSGSDYSRT